MSSKSLIFFLPVNIVTILSFVIMVQVLTGQTGAHETWRMMASIAGFIIFAVYNLFITFRLGRLEEKCNTNQPF